MPPSNPETSDATVVFNPTSGTGNHRQEIRDRVSLLGWELKPTEREGHAIELTREAIDAGATTVAAAGGDGTLNEVIRGVVAADALDTVTVGVVPAGTGNDFASHIGLTTIDEAFAAIQRGERRQLDLGLANDTPFMNSCIAGLTARASARTSSEEKARLGVLAYVMTTFRVLSEFHGLQISAEVKEGTMATPVWTGPAAMVLAGNGRRFSLTGGTQANIEDGFLDVTIVEDAAARQLVEEQARERLLGEENPHITRLLASSLELSVETDDPATFSLDGEMEEFTSVTLTTEPQALRMPVGDSYQPLPEEP